MADDLNATMELASAALQDMDYTGCEAACLDALALARDNDHWSDYARILLPLQEARRQRRMLAADGTIRLGTHGLTAPPVTWLKDRAPGCMVVTSPHTADDAERLFDAARRGGHCVEVLYAVPDPTGEQWHCSTFRGPSVNVTRPAPPAAWVHRWIAPGSTETPNPPGAGGVSTDGTACSAADWFVETAESLGDTALAAVAADLPEVERLLALERCLKGIDTHEILHQRLGDAARALARAGH